MSLPTNARTALSKPWLFTLASLGSAVEFYDFVVFVFLAGPIASVFFPPTIPNWSRLLQTYALLSVEYFARPLGGIVMAHRYAIGFVRDQSAYSACMDFGGRGGDLR
jgi:hypothetical protein